MILVSQCNPSIQFQWLRYLETDRPLLIIDIVNLERRLPQNHSLHCQFRGIHGHNNSVMIFFRSFLRERQIWINKEGVTQDFEMSIFVRSTPEFHDVSFLKRGTLVTRGGAGYRSLHYPLSRTKG